MVKRSNYFNTIIIAITAILGISGCATYLPVTMVAEGREYSVVVAETLDSGFDITVTDAATFIAAPNRKEIQEPLQSVYMSTIQEVCPNGIKQVIPISIPLSTSKKAKVYCSDGTQQISKKDTSNQNGIFPKMPTVVSFKQTPKNANDVAVIIGNANYATGKDIPNVIPAYADAASIKLYVTQALGIIEENIIFIKDASQGKLTATFGSATNPKGQLFN